MYRTPVALSRFRPYAFHVALAVYIPALLYADVHTQTLSQQHLLGGLTFAFLFLARLFPAAVRPSPPRKPDQKTPDHDGN